MSSVREILEKHSLRPSKSLGQNFISEPGICKRMAELSGAGKDMPALEIGAGLGALTAELAKLGGRVVAVELDPRLIPALSENLKGFENVEIVNADFLKLDLQSFSKEHFGGEKFCVCANLPYYITSPVIMRLLETKLPLTQATVMVQKEAGERICSRPGERECGAVSVSVWYHAEPKLLFPVGRGNFYPRPNVDSVVLNLKVREKPPVMVSDEDKFFEMVRSAFSKRRKTAANAIAYHGIYDKTRVEDILSEMGIDKSVRIERLSLIELAALFNALES